MGSLLEMGYEGLAVSPHSGPGVELSFQGLMDQAGEGWPKVMGLGEFRGSGDTRPPPAWGSLGSGQV